MAKDKPLIFPLEELPDRYQKDNAIFAVGAMVLAVAWVQWVINTWRISYERWRHSRRPGVWWPRWPRRIEIFNYMRGESCAAICDRIRRYGIPHQKTWIEWDLWPDKMGVGIRFYIYVAAEQWQMADMILTQDDQDNYTVESAPGELRGYSLGEPWGVGAKARSFDEALTYWLTRGAWAQGRGPVGATRRPQKRQTPRTANTARKRRPIDK